MIHLFQSPKNNAKRTLVFLHGTGGDERDLLFLASELDPDAGVLSLRGDVVEAGQNRFFKRLAPGVFDQADLKKRTANLERFLMESSKKYGFDLSHVELVGYSNGANIAASLLLQTATEIEGAILFHPMLPCEPSDLAHKQGIKVFLAASTNDPIAPFETAKALELALRRIGHEVRMHVGASGHRLTNESIRAAKEWLAASTHL